MKSLVELHGGNVEAESQGAGAGSQFKICLPLLQRLSGTPSPEISDVQQVTNRTPLRLLVVDDNQDAATMLCALLEATGYEVAAEHHPRAALERALHQQYDAYLIDIGLPDMDGTELARRLRAMPSGKNALMIAITGYGQQFDRRNALRAGFDHYFVKPANPVKLASVLADFRKT